MTAAVWPDHLLTLEEFVELPEDNSRRYELQEGVLIVSPRANLFHQRVAHRLVTMLNDQLPSEWEAVGDGEMITDPGFPASVRVPDVVVVEEKLVSSAAARFTAEDALLAVEIISPGSQRTDTLVKPVECAKAGIPNYWVIDLNDPLSLVAYHQVGDLGYQKAPAVTGTFTTSEPFSLRVDLAALSRRA
ncbi:Uma2 family endonuclease [Actinophytocola sp.]|uniref:Uma2 family endonuclease n=1 Tax=Actinophytocola sp. TaxID=1872138 RepID=UPI002ED49CD8